MQVSRSVSQINTGRRHRFSRLTRRSLRSFLVALGITTCLGVIPGVAHAGVNGQHIRIHPHGATSVDVRGPNQTGSTVSYLNLSTSSGVTTIPNWWWKGQITVTYHLNGKTLGDAKCYVPQSQSGSDTTDCWGDHLYQGQSLQTWDQLVSSGTDTSAGKYRLVMQDDGNLVEYLVSNANVVPWNSESTVASHEPFHLDLQSSDGNLVIYRGAPSDRTRPVWDTRTNEASNPTKRLRVQDDSNVVVYRGTGSSDAPWHTSRLNDVAAAAAATIGQVYIQDPATAQLAGGSNWSARCESLIYMVAWKPFGKTYGSALLDFYAHKNAGQIHSGRPPKGAVVYWNPPGSNGNGHVGIGLGGGRVVTTIGTSTDQRYANAQNNYDYTAFAPYLGWAWPNSAP